MEDSTRISVVIPALGTRDAAHGWMAEMQTKATLQKARVLEAPVQCRKRIGKSKISGTISGSIAAGTKMLVTIFRAAVGRL
jgi:hypothetical protein